ncbi:MAG: nucleotide exchange factor GrpE, partial [Clostridia bacterium]|nr:nucleotide exchange factor GrpE [Clostridia bacterium]
MSTKKTPPNSSEEKDRASTEKIADPTESAEVTETAGKSNKTEDQAVASLEKAQAELTAEKDKYLRVLAEYDNYRKRSQKERECIYSDVRADTITAFLPVYDNLERALKQETNDDAYSKGVEMILTQFKEIMSKLGACEIVACTGTKFDPTIHDAVMHVDDENLGEGVIAEEFQKGFRLADRVIR